MEIVTINQFNVLHLLFNLNHMFRLAFVYKSLSIKLFITLAEMYFINQIPTFHLKLTDVFSTYQLTNCKLRFLKHKLLSR